VLTTKEHIDKYKEYEKIGLYNEHINPVNFDKTIPVTINFCYTKKPFFRTLKDFLLRLFIVNPFTFFVNIFRFKTKVFGKENLKGIKSAIATLNHVNIYDCLVAKYALKSKKLYVVGAEFNNMKGLYGDCMRAGGMLPLSTKHTVMKKFCDGVKYHLNKRHFVLFYPEQSMWYNYEFIRPYKLGAFHFAVKNDVPILPMVITFRETGKKDKFGVEKKYTTIRILKPIYSDKKLSDKENMYYLCQKNHDECESFVKMIYNSKKY